MADAKITELTVLTTPADGDFIPIVDVDDTTDSVNGTTKKITHDNLITRNASTTVKGVTKLSVAPVSATNPIATGTNDTRIPVAFAIDAAGTDTYVITPSPAITAYTAGQIITFQAGTANTNACSLNVNGLGAKAIKKDVSVDLVTGDILLNQIVTVIYDGTNMQMQSNYTQTGITTDIATLNSRSLYTVGALDNALVKTYFNIQLPFILWTGSTSGALTTDFSNWIRSSTDIVVSLLHSDFVNAGADSIAMDLMPTSLLQFDDSGVVILDWWAKLPATGTGDINMGFADDLANQYQLVYNSTTQSRVVFAQRGSTGVLYATVNKNAVGVTNTIIDLGGITITNYNNYRIELDINNYAKFYINGVLKTTILATDPNFPDTNADVTVGFGRSNTSLFKVTAPTLSIEMNP